MVSSKANQTTVYYSTSYPPLTFLSPYTSPISLNRPPFPYPILLCIPTSSYAPLLHNKPCTTLSTPSLPVSPFTNHTHSNPAFTIPIPVHPTLPSLHLNLRHLRCHPLFPAPYIYLPLTLISPHSSCFPHSHLPTPLSLSTQQSYHINTYAARYRP
jgi:hypothetical protein